MQSWEASAREAIRDLVAVYAHAADGGRIDELVELFVVDGVMRIDDRDPLAGRDAIRAFLGGTRDHLRAGAPAPPRLRHHVSSLRLVIDAPDAARGDAYFLVLSDVGVDHWGRYRDRYVKTAAGWRFAERRVRLDGMTPGSWAARRRAASD